MANIGNHKPQLLKQIELEKPSINKIEDILNMYEDLTLNELRSVIPDEMYTLLLDKIRDPQEKALWIECCENTWEGLPVSNSSEIEKAIAAVDKGINKVTIYIERYPNGPKYNEANILYSELYNKKQELENKKVITIGGEREKNDWETLDKGNYALLRNYLRKYPNSIHKDEIDDLMWTNTINAPRLQNFERYLQDLPDGCHAQEAQNAINEFSEWEEVKRSGDIFLVDDYRDNHPHSPFKGEIDRVYYDLSDKVMENMQNNPADFKYNDVLRLIQADIFKDWELIDKGLMSEDSWETLKELETVKEELPDLKNFVMNSVEGTAPGATDVFLFGTPGTGKTCMLMGLVGANGSQFQKGDDQLNYSLNLQQYGGNYAAALQSFIYAGITPGSTHGSFVTTFHGNIQEKSRKGNIIDHRINLVEMSGEEFARRIADNEKATVSFEDMGTGATRVMSNSNRKIFFIIVDPTVDKVKITFLEDVRDEEGNVIDQRVRKKYIDQRIILSKFVSLFELPENQEIMKRVDAIHFIVTKSDFLDKDGERGNVAAELLRMKYQATVTSLKNYCENSKRINRSTKYSPQVFTFSLGKFYLGDIFKFDAYETHKIINAIRIISSGEKSDSWLDKLKRTFG